ncbi:hypothetical protein LTR08_007725 [Meristemomyces frigidus]|nr:hypothetical protein LTR08_007725 [Meristemomyces frigidus]
MARAIMRTLIALQLILVVLLTFSPFANAVSKCTNKCWKKAVIESNCQGATHVDEQNCMCGDWAHKYVIVGYYVLHTPHTVFPNPCSQLTPSQDFAVCNRKCIYMGDFGGLKDFQKCPPVFDNDGTPVLGWGSSDNMQVNTTSQVEDESSISKPSSKPSSISESSEDMLSVVDKRQIIGQIPWRHATTTKPKPVYTHYSNAVSATVGFCAVSGSSCNEKDAIDVVPSDSSIATAVTIEGTLSASAAASATVEASAATATPAALEVRDAKFVPSLVRMCNATDLVDCYIPLAPDFTDILKQRDASGTTLIPWAPTTLATYAANTWDGGPPSTLSVYAPNTFPGQAPPPKRYYSVSPSENCALRGVCNDCDPKGVCGVEERDEDA